MVWNNLGSPLYNAVERHNSSAPSPVSEQKEEKLPPREHHEKQYIGNSQPFSQLFRDRDTLLLAAVMLILLHEKADTKLILALAFVIFS